MWMAKSQWRETLMMLDDGTITATSTQAWRFTVARQPQGDQGDLKTLIITAYYTCFAQACIAPMAKPC
jgi:hypothetical protein